MTDVVVLQIIQSSFWVLVIGTIVLVFRKELKFILQSLGSFEVAGASFQLSDRKETLRSYALLSEILIDLLSRGDRIDEIRSLLHPSQVEELGTFVLKYTAEVPTEEWNEELLKNVAYLLLRFGRYKHAVQIYDALLDKRPDHLDLINLKALALMTSRLPEPIKLAKDLYDSLTKRYPELPNIRFNYALVLSLSGTVEEAYKEMQRAIVDGFYGAEESLLNDPLFHYAREARPDLLENLQTFLRNKNGEVNEV